MSGEVRTDFLTWLGLFWWFGTNYVFGMRNIMFLLKKKVVTSLGRRRSWLVLGNSESPRGRRSQSAHSERGCQHPGMGWPSPLAGLALRLRCPESWLGCEPLQVLWHQWLQSPLPSTPRESLAELLRGLLGFLSIGRRVLFNQVPWKLVSARSHFWIPFSSLVKSFWRV